MGEPINANGTEIWTERRGTDPTSCSSRGSATPPKRGSHSSTASRTVTASPPSTTAVRGARRFPRTPLGEHDGRRCRRAAASAGDSQPTSWASRWAAPSPRAGLRHPELVRSLVLVSTYARPDALWRSQLDFWRWLAEVAPGERAFLEAFFVGLHAARTRRRHGESTHRGGAGLPPQAVRGGLSGASRRLPHARHGGSPSGDRCADARTVGRARHHPAGSLRSVGGRTNSEGTLRGHGWGGTQPFQESEEFDARVEAFWRDVEAQG